MGEACKPRSREQQQHDRAVHGEALVETLVREVLHAGPGELSPHRHSQNSAEQEEHHRRNEVEIAYHLVVCGDHPLPRDRAKLTLWRRDLGGGCSTLQRRHRVPSSELLAGALAWAGPLASPICPLATSDFR